MPVTAWQGVGFGVVSGDPASVPGIVVNGGGTGGTPAPTTGRLYPD